MTSKELHLWALVALAGCSSKLLVDQQGFPDDAGGPLPSSTGGVQTGAGMGGDAGAGAVGWGGGGMAGYAPRGNLGEPCIPGGTLNEASGTVAETMVVTFDRCDDGLMCDPTGSCVPVPDCSQGGSICTVRRVKPRMAGAGGQGGQGGSTTTGGAPPAAMEQIGVTAMTADASNLYWVEYGSRDPLGNYQNDGSLLALSLNSGSTTSVATGLAGPVDLGVTSSHAYVYVDGAPFVGSPIRPQLLRLPLVGGTPEIVERVDVPVWGQLGGFASAGDRAFWTTDFSTIRSMTAATETTSVVVVAESPRTLKTDETHLYYADCGGGHCSRISRVPIEGGAPELAVDGLDSSVFAPGGPFLYAIEPSAGMVLQRAPKSGGPWVRVQALGAGSAAGRFDIVGSRYFVHTRMPYVVIGANSFATMGILTGTIGSSLPPVRMVHRLSRGSVIDGLWVGTANHLYWSDGYAIYRRALDGPP